AEVEREARAQIKIALKNIPHLSHISGHMGSTAFAPEVVELMERLSREYNLPVVDRKKAMDLYGFSYAGYAGPKKTPEEKERSFINMLKGLEPGRNYMFIDHPALDNEEMQTVGHVGYEDVAKDRQGVTDLFTSDRVKQVIKERNIELISYNDLTKGLPRYEASKALDKAFDKYIDAVVKAKQDLHSIMILKGGKVVKECWMGEGEMNKPHKLFSVSKTFTATAIGFAVDEGKLNVTDKVISFFP
ncbi:YdjC family protein, partial [gut metagenome]